MASGVPHSGGPGLNEIFSLFNIGIVIFVGFFLNRKKITKALLERKEGISKSLIGLREKLFSMRSEIKVAKNQIENIENEKKEIVARVQNEGEKLKDKLVNEAKESARRIEKDSQSSGASELAANKKLLASGLLDQAIESSVIRIQKGEASVDQKELHNALVERFLNEFPENLSGESSFKGVSHVEA